jgi:hypothetical protein
MRITALRAPATSSVGLPVQIEVEFLGAECYQKGFVVRSWFDRPGFDPTPKPGSVFAYWVGVGEPGAIRWSFLPVPETCVRPGSTTVSFTPRWAGPWVVWAEKPANLHGPWPDATASFQVLP